VTTNLQPDAKGAEAMTSTTAEPESHQSSSPGEQPAPKSKAKLFIIMGVIVAVAIAIALVWWLRSRGKETTDDAYVDAAIVRVSPRSPGQIVQLVVTDNQRVRKGQLLAVVDTSVSATQLQCGWQIRS
jgi:membrane fusion protein (multidrug efflux system)